MADETFTHEHAERAQVATAAIVCHSQLSQLVEAGLRLDDEQAADLAELLRKASPDKPRAKSKD